MAVDVQLYQKCSVNKVIFGVGGVTLKEGNYILREENEHNE